MRDIRKNKKINIHKNNPALIGKFKQRSNATLILDLYDEFSNYVDLSNQEISIRVERPDGVTFEQVDNITKSSNVLTVKLKNEVLEVEGKCRVELNLKDSEGQMNTADFFFEVVESVLSDDVVFSSEDYESLEKALVVFRIESNALMKKLDDNEKVRISNENTRKSQEANRGDAENTRNSNENVRISQENTRKSQEEDRKSNETTRQNQESVRQGNENTRKSQENNRLSKENERKTNEDTRKSNESDRQSRFTKLESDGRRLIAEMNTAIDGTITREVTEARGTKAKLGLRLNDMEQQSVENTNRIEQLEDLTPVWQEHEGTGSITVNDSFDGTTKDLVVRGRTLNNLTTTKYFKMLKSNRGAVPISTGAMIKPSTVYSIIFDVIGIKKGDLNDFSISGKDFDVVESDIIRIPSIGRYMIKIRTNSNFSYNGKIVIKGLAQDWLTDDLFIEFSNFILLEGYDTSYNNIKHFDSIASAGELEDNKILIKSVGKNLIKPPSTRLVKTRGNCEITYDVDGSFILNGSADIAGGRLDFVGKTPTIKLYKGKTYFISAKKLSGSSSDGIHYAGGIYFSDKNTNVTAFSYHGTPVKYIPSEDIEVSCGINISQNVIYTNLKIVPMIEENTVATDYEQFRSKLIEIPLPFQKGLKSTLDGSVYDEINGNTGEIIQRVSDEYTALSKPVIHKINDIQLNTFDETTHITQENNILSDISFKSKVSLSSQAKRLTEENKALKEENISLKEHSIKTIEEQEVQDQKITTTMLANTELFEMMLNFMSMQLDSKQFKGGELNMVEVYVTLIIQGDKTLEQVPTIIRPKVEEKLRLLGVIA